ncbi:MAG: cysteine desulfurase [Bacteroidia bacterium]
MKAVATEVINIQEIRKNFPILSQQVYGNPLVYLDNAATSQKPQQVLEAIRKYYSEYNSNIHRGVHYLSEKATNEYENARSYIADFINAKPQEINFLRGTTEAVNLVAQAWGRENIKAGDEIIISTMEHHSNIVPWQMLCEQKQAHLKIIPVNDAGELDMEAFHKLLNERTRLVSVVYISNALGTINPVEEIIEAAHALDVPVMIDGAQAIPHMAVDVKKLDCDFFAFSGHKAYGPTGIGVLYGKQALLEKMQPYQGGGEMIQSVTFEKTTYNELPYKFEAGTPNICGGIAMAEALRYIRQIGYDSIGTHEQELLEYGHQRLGEIEGMRFIGTAARKAGAISFLVDKIHPYDIGVVLDKLGIAIRTGHHCTQPLMKRFDIAGTCRASFAMYNTKEEIDALVAGVKRAVEMLR